MTSNALVLDAQMHRVLAIASALRAALATARVHIYLPFGLASLARNTHRLRVSLESVRPGECSDDELIGFQEALLHLRELQRINVAVVARLRKVLPSVLLWAYRGFLESLERNSARLVDIIDELEMDTDPQLEAALHKAMSNLAPEGDRDWRTSLKSMQN